MYFYHEAYHDAYYAQAALEDLRSPRRHDDRTYEPLRIPAILTWLVAVSVAVCAIFIAINCLS